MVGPADDHRARRRRRPARRLRRHREPGRAPAAAAAHRGDRARGGAYLVDRPRGSAACSACSCSSPSTCSSTLGLSPLTTGLAFLPMTAVIVVTSTTVQTRVLPTHRAAPLISVGMALGSSAMLLLTSSRRRRATPATCCPACSCSAWAWAASSPPRSARATLGVDRDDAGVASAMVNTSQQVGGSVGTALLSTIFATAAAS